MGYIGVRLANKEGGKPYDYLPSNLKDFEKKIKNLSPETQEANRKIRIGGLQMFSWLMELAHLNFKTLDKKDKEKSVYLRVFTVMPTLMKHIIDGKYLSLEKIDSLFLNCTSKDIAPLLLYLRGKPIHKTNIVEIDPKLAYEYMQKTGTDLPEGLKQNQKLVNAIQELSQTNKPVAQENNQQIIQKKIKNSSLKTLLKIKKKNIKRPYKIFLI